MHARQLQIINRRKFVCNGICIKQSIDSEMSRPRVCLAPFPVFPLTLTEKVAWDEYAHAMHFVFTFITRAVNCCVDNVCAKRQF